VHKTETELTILDLSPTYIFAKKLNILILCIVYVVALRSHNLPWDMLSIGAFLICFLICLLIIAWPQKAIIPYFILQEGQKGACYGARSKELDDAQFVLSESNSRLSMLGCWLVFIPLRNKHDKVQFLPWSKKRITIFVPKQYLFLDDYKSLCRHLIWHTKA
jgi:hypothetical protein